MYCEESDTGNFVEDEYVTRSNVEDLSLFDTTSRDSGFEELGMELSTEADFLEEFGEINVAIKADLPPHLDVLINGPELKISDRQSTTFSDSCYLKEVNPLINGNSQQADAEEYETTFSLRKRKYVTTQTETCSTVSTENSHLKFHCSEDVIKSALERCEFDPDLIADFSRCYSLPLTVSRHHDLKAIAATTLKNLLDGKFSGRVPSFTIIDCRYPYEFQGGHIPGAINLYTHEQCSAMLEEISFNGKLDKPNVLIFHCEFSAERGPNLYRYMRQEDRKKNMQMYPSLYFPEMYILEGGYKRFYEEYSNMCSPPSYIEMRDPRHTNDMLLCRQTSRTWDSDMKNCMRKRSSKKN
ncbi:M-phase inducer phosphatase isoform X1 [Dendroctonus ponderosae]|uniref:protein-tyrosine-phosphatase n=1 Tax=Dendroctonus ponderosae TaxID=77166 RepID=A0AAR5P333_DENPD|nr:M-phase inducer phosphatase isoform X1 [Dendroctonus ponderosae]XP_048526122.1 M-phase inducer phosphatase isoform X1 [Dendroctonus ponderosae]XP_048526123.1 M-phase inducer phosphatase isoform X1 [Dendroctonus ponderosae]XP_048526124.1 M-phase inducer phosphatase isoform X1 [Dendroctonus ponderosae]XP_048526125.1 M-phase inducer phosphatase isoform X1 [Dendroctonus ponderosae]XP_048526126.1 M-phase inducer phosphatase isoform X1 [Dendroctonus ponderosae]KAH1023036.1 hypothetical protein H